MRLQTYCELSRLQCCDDCLARTFCLEPCRGKYSAAARIQSLQHPEAFPSKEPQLTRTFNDLYTHELEMLISAESQMIDLLPTLAAGTDTVELRKALLAQVEGCTAQRSMLQGLLQALGQPLKVPVSRGIQSLLDECTVLLRSFPTGNLRDAVMIAHMQRAEHYKIAAYSSLQEYAKLLGDRDATEHLGQAAKAVTLVSRNLGAISIQVNAEAYVDTRIEGT